MNAPAGRGPDRPGDMPAVVGTGTGAETGIRPSGRLDLAGLAGHAGLVRLFGLLPEARLVGGSVRDLLAGTDPGDLDLATPEPPEDVQATLTRAGIRVVATGLAHGTITAIIDRIPYEITTLRRDVATDGRHAVVAWTRDWRADAARRDFTINAMSCGADGIVHDHFGGRDDLAARRVRFVGDPALRIEEDALRILRFFRFTARFATLPDPEARTAIAARAALVAGLSRERVATELLALLAGPRAAAMVAAMAELGVLEHVVPVDASGPSRLGALIAAGAPPDPVLRLAALARDAGAAGRSLRLSNDRIARLEQAVATDIVPEPGWDDDARRRALSQVSVRALCDRTWLAQIAALPDRGASSAMQAAARVPARADMQAGLWDDLRRSLAAMPRPVFPLAGRDALAAGLTPGPVLGRALRGVEAWWRQGGCRADRQACLDRLARAVAS